MYTITVRITGAKGKYPVKWDRTTKKYVVPLKPLQKEFNEPSAITTETVGEVVAHILSNYPINSMEIAKFPR